MVSVQGIRRELQPLTDATAAALPAQLGVYEIVDESGGTLMIGQAGATEPFGLRSALREQAAQHRGARFRHECTHGYRTRWQELLMQHVAEHGALPVGNADDQRFIGRLR